MKKLVFTLAFVAGFAAFAPADTYSVKSPDGKLELAFSDGETVKFSLYSEGKPLLENCAVAMDTDKGVLGKNAAIWGCSRSEHRGEISPVYGMRKKISDVYNEMRLKFDNFAIVARAYNDAAAYRFATSFKGEMIVKDELLDLAGISAGDKIVCHNVQSDKTSFEKNWTRGVAGDLRKKANCSLPFFFEKGGKKIAIAESAWLDYPGMRIVWDAAAPNPRAKFSRAPRKLGFNDSPNAYFVERGGMYLVKETEDYIAKTKGMRQFPWRAFIVAENDVDFADNDTVYKLAEPSRVADTSWIKVGTSVWDWWVNWNTEGVDFPLGFNDKMCKYYIDFAAANNIPFVTFDAGWHVGRDSYFEIYNKTENFLNGKPVVDIPAAVKYADSKGVKVIIWVFSKVLYDCPRRALDLFKSWGVYGLKIDFSDRDDQWLIRHIENVTRLAAERQMVIDWHGCPAPAGFQRTYPNAVNFEAVRGGEVNKWSSEITPSHNVDLVFTRMLSGSMDYTSGGMRNCAEGSWSKSNDFPRVQGTRAHMLSHYVLFNEPLKMLSDMPSEYVKFPEQLKFMAEVPTSWDDTKALCGKMGEYVVVARRKGAVWYVAGMCDWGGKSVEIDLSKFLPKGGKFKAEIFRDGANANRIATDCAREVREVKSSDVLKIEMKRGGGFAIKLMPESGWIF